MLTKPGSLWKIYLTTSTEAEEAILELFQEHFPGSPWVYTDAKTGTTKVGLFLGRLPKDADERLVRFKRGLRNIRRCGLALASTRVNVSRIQAENWAESWKRHFQAIAVGRKLLILPSWRKRRPHPGQAIVELDPGLSFGTGHHPTTRFCLQELVRCRPRREPVSCLDIGTGSGILAIAAVKLGYAPVQGFDVDPDAVRIARENAARNGVQHALKIVRRDLGRWHPRPHEPVFGLICANLSEDQLLAHGTAIVSRVAAGGQLVLAGITAAGFEGVRAAYEGAGLVLIRSVQTREWRSGTFCFKALRVLR